ncbi:MAG: hypothetical protein ACREMQ_14005, partial [Longimicrobiales bacterium]
GDGLAHTCIIMLIAAKCQHTPAREFSGKPELRLVGRAAALSILPSLFGFIPNSRAICTLRVTRAAAKRCPR